MKELFSAAVTFMLLIVFAYLVVRGVLIARCMANVECTALGTEDFTDRMGTTLALISGLISALVVAELSVTRTGEVPGARLVAPELLERHRLPLQIVTGLYLCVWLLGGVLAFFFGFLLADEKSTLQPLADLGQSWLGVAVGAGYAYFGVNR